MSKEMILMTLRYFRLTLGQAFPDNPVKVEHSLWTTRQEVHDLSWQEATGHRFACRVEIGDELLCNQFTLTNQEIALSRSLDSLLTNQCDSRVVAMQAEYHKRTKP